MGTPSEEIVYFGRRMSERWMTNAAGGNISMRLEDQIYISPRYADYKWGWQLRPEQIVSGPIHSDELLANASFSRSDVWEEQYNRYLKVTGLPAIT